MHSKNEKDASVMATHINIVLLEPQIPQNTGNIARTCAATGASLHLIKPMGFEVDDKKLKRAGLDYWHQLDITYYDGWNDFITKNPDAELFYFSTKARRIYTDISYPSRVYLVFGREDAGLPESLLKENPETSLRIPMIDEARSLNLSNTVAIATYEILRQWNYPNLLCEGQLTKFTW